MNVKNKIKKEDYALDIFKGTCELNNYQRIDTSIEYDGTLRKDLIKGMVEKLKNEKLTGKFYTYGIVLNKEEELHMMSIIMGNMNNYRLCELINMNVKALYNMELYNVTVRISNKDIIEKLRMLDLTVCEEESTNKIEIEVNDKVLMSGAYNKTYAYLNLNYNTLEGIMKYEDNLALDAYIMPEDLNILDDALLIATYLSDAGIRVDVDYELKKEVLSTEFIIKVSSEDISKYLVRLLDTKTNEEKEVSINDLVGELLYF